MFMKKENGALRSRLASLESDRILGRIAPDAYACEAVDIIKMLDKLGEPLSAKESELLKKVLHNRDISNVFLPNITTPRSLGFKQDKASIGGYVAASRDIGEYFSQSTFFENLSHRLLFIVLSTDNSALLSASRDIDAVDKSYK